MTETNPNEELRWRLELLRTKLEEGKIHFAAHLAEDVERSLGAVRYGIDGKIDLETVDGRVRSLALAVAGLQQREDAKNAISLRDISGAYFEAIDASFGKLAKDINEKGYNPNQAARAISESEVSVEELTSNIPKFIDDLERFWSSASESSTYHIQDIPGLKAVYGGDLFPSYTRNIASAIGLYTDTIVLSDPFWQSRHIFENASNKQRTYYLIKHALNVLTYKELATLMLQRRLLS